MKLPLLPSCRGFNDAVNGFNDDGWSLINCDGAEDVTLAINSSKNLNTSYDPVNSLAFHGGILCAKASMLLQVCLNLFLWSFGIFHSSLWSCFEVSF